MQYESRMCNNPETGEDGDDCLLTGGKGRAKEEMISRSCNIQACPGKIWTNVYNLYIVVENYETKKTIIYVLQIWIIIKLPKIWLF